jgi:hypothetical protein
MRDGLQFGKYVTTYDHPDKFIKNGPNPLINGGEDTKIFLGKLSHWRITNSTVQTFACYIKTLKEDWDILHKHNFNGKTPDSFKTFIELGKEGKRVVVSIPGRSTHCHSQWLSPLKDWSLETGNIKIWMSNGEINLIKKYLNPNMTMLEWGSGGSTLEFSKLVKEYISIEHDHAWYLKIKKELNNRNLNNVDYHYIPNDLPRSYPHTKEEEFRSYIDLPWTFPNPYHYDVVLIDGRGRNWCAEYIRDLLNPQAIVFIHDWDRPKYHEVLQWYKIIDQCDKLVALQVK